MVASLTKLAEGVSPSRGRTIAAPPSCQHPVAEWLRQPATIVGACSARLARSTYPGSKCPCLSSARRNKLSAAKRTCARNLAGKPAGVDPRRTDFPPLAASPQELGIGDGNLAHWFTTKVQPHEAVLRSYLRGSFPEVREVDDIVQESYLRLWRVRVAAPVASAKALLFSIARNVARDFARRARRSPILSVAELSVLPVVAEHPSAYDHLSAQEKIDLLGVAVGTLPARCREIIVLHKIRGHSQREVASMLGLAEKTVENQVAIGTRRCAEFFRRRGILHY